MLGAEDEAATFAVVTTSPAWSARLAVGTATSGGGRPLQQDRVVVAMDLANLVPPPAMDLVGVLDGHGFRGGRAADFVRQVRRMAPSEAAGRAGQA